MSHVLATLSASDSPDEVERMFYDALHHARIDALMAVWADDDDILCVHPGGPRLLGAAAIRTGFEAVFASGGLSIQVDQVHRMQTATAAVHSVLEYLQVATKTGPRSAWVVATNIYILGTQGWRLLAHHASPADPLDVSSHQATPTLLH